MTNRRSETEATCPTCGRTFHPWIKFGGTLGVYCSLTCRDGWRGFGREYPFSGPPDPEPEAEEAPPEADEPAGEPEAVGEDLQGEPPASGPEGHCRACNRDVPLDQDGRCPVHLVDTIPPSHGRRGQRWVAGAWSPPYDHRSRTGAPQGPTPWRKGLAPGDGSITPLLTLRTRLRAAPKPKAAPADKPPRPLRAPIPCLFCGAPFEAYGRGMQRTRHCSVRCATAARCRSRGEPVPVAPGSWATCYLACVNCGGTEYVHIGRGYCRPCYKAARDRAIRDGTPWPPVPDSSTTRTAVSA